MEGKEAVGPLNSTQPGGLLRAADAAQQQLLYLCTSITCMLQTAVAVMSVASACCVTVCGNCLYLDSKPHHLQGQMPVAVMYVVSECCVAVIRICLHLYAVSNSFVAKCCVLCSGWVY